MENWFNLDTTCWSNMSPINEAYFGETPHLTNALRYLGQFRAKYSGHKYKVDIKAITDPFLQKFNQEMALEFGFEVFDMQISFDQTFNGCTLPVGMKLDSGDTRKFVEKTKHGYKFKKEAKYYCLIFMNAGILFDKMFTDRECMAVILHEVGHNFAGAVNNAIGMFEGIHRTLNIFTTILKGLKWPGEALLMGLIFTNKGQKLLHDIEVMCRKEYPKMMEFGDWFIAIIGILKSLQREANFIRGLLMIPFIPAQYAWALGSVFARKLRVFMAEPAMVLYELYGYPHEKFSDNFAAMYGYGPDMASAFGKLKTKGDLVSKKLVNEHVPILSGCYNLILLPIRLITSPFDAHPIELERAVSDMRALKEELRHCDPRMRKHIESDIKQIEKDIHEYYLVRGKTEDVVNIGDRLWFTVLYNTLGGDFRHIWMDWLFKSKEQMTSKTDKETSKK